jgi:8-oxo-dGTP pyrophosphatase MutT (NUDIX family)
MRRLLVADRMVGGLSSEDLQSSASGHLVFVQKAFVTSNDSLLLVQKSSSDPYYPDLWEVPGGRMELKEDPDGHIRRETWEETGIEVDPGAPFHIWHWFMPDTSDISAWVQAIAVARLCRPRPAQSAPTPSTKNQVNGDHLRQARWVPIARIPDLNLIPGVDDAFKHFRNLRQDETPGVLANLR